MSLPSVPNVYVQPLVEYDRITFWWLPSSEPVESYTLECDSISYSNTYSPTTYEAFVTNLSPFTQYSFKLKATNVTGDSEYGFFDTVTTGYRPDPPTSLTATEEFFTTGTTISWIPPIYQGGSPVFDYVLTAKAFGTSNIPAPENDLFLSTDFPTNTSLYPLNLSNDYKVTIQAINSCGYSPMSEHIWIYNLEHPGSIQFSGTSNYCALTNPSPFALSTTDFTVELFFKLDTPLTNTPYLFSSATTLGETFSLQLQTNQFVLTYPSASGLQTETFGSETDVIGGWHHIAIVGETVLTNRLINIYLDGVLYHTTINPSYSFTDPLLDFTIGQRSSPSLTNNFQGYISNLRFVTGLAVYISDFILPTIPLGVISGMDIQTELLLNVIDAGTLLTDSSGLDRTITNFGVSYSLQHP
jgi:hypothetical protein